MEAVRGKTFMFTGTLSITREKAQETVVELGGIAGSSLSKSTDFLVCGEDQVGRSSKFIRAGLLGVTRVDEEYFWEMVKEAKKEALGGILLTKEELEGDISDSKWLEVSNKNPGLRIMTEEQLSRLLEACKIEERVDVPKEGYIPPLGKRICPYCRYEIPYSIDRNFWFCFKCHLFSDVGQEEGRHACVDWDELMDIPVESGKYVRCKVCGNVKFVGKGDDDLAQASLVNYVHSVEFAAIIAKKIEDNDGKGNHVGGSMDEVERQKLYNKWLEREQRKRALEGV